MEKFLLSPRPNTHWKGPQGGAGGRTEEGRPNTKEQRAGREGEQGGATPWTILPLWDSICSQVSKLIRSQGNGSVRFLSQSKNVLDCFG